MRFVLDSNYLSECVRAKGLTETQKRSTTLVLPCLIVREMCQGEIDRSLLRPLLDYDLRFGMEFRNILCWMAKMDERAIQLFEPIIPTSSEVHSELLGWIENPPEKALDGARRQKQEVETLADELRTQAKELKTKNRGRPKCRDIDEAVKRFAWGSESLVGKFVVEAVSEHGRRSVRARPKDSLFLAAMDNVYLGRFLRLHLCYRLAYSRLWQCDRLQFAVCGNDFVDQTLALYASDGDVIITNDKKFRMAFRHIDPEEKVALKTWDECVEMIKAREV